MHGTPCDDSFSSNQLYWSLLSTRVPGYQPSFTEIRREYTITNVCSIFGPLITSGLAEIKHLGRRYTMSIGATIIAAFFFGYTVIKKPAQNLALSSCICRFIPCPCSVCVSLLTGNVAAYINVYYGTLSAYTPEVFLSAHRTTGNGIANSLNRVMGLVIAVTTDTATVTP